jgi:hypothetical protein
VFAGLDQWKRFAVEERERCHGCWEYVAGNQCCLAQIRGVLEEWNDSEVKFVGQSNLRRYQSEIVEY